MDAAAPPVECFFCRSLEDRAAFEERGVYEDDLLRATHPIEEEGPTFLGTVLVQTKRHAEGLAGLTDAEAERLGWLVTRLSRALGTTVGAAWTYAYCFSEGYRHVHLFVDARYPNLPAAHVRLGLHEWPDAPRGDPAAVRALAHRLRAELAAAP